MPHKKSVKEMLDEEMAKFKDSDFNQNLKTVWMMEDNQEIVWYPTEENRNFECDKCGIKAANYCMLKGKKTFACSSCMWSYKKEDK